jgi:ComF family protein
MHRIRQSKRRIAKMTRWGIDLIYPPHCACCRAELEEAERPAELCQECRKMLIPAIWNPCPRCGGLVEGLAATLKGCNACADTPFHFDTVVALGDYRCGLKPIIFRMKQESGAPLALAVGKLLANERREMLQNLLPDLIIPIPMHWWHRYRRGVNNPEMIARCLADGLDIPCRRWVLQRCKKTLTQSNLQPKQRFLNVRGAFRVRFARQIRGRRILLVDDVLTTGATCSEAAKMLKQAGAAMVAVAVVARARGESR